MSQIYFTSSYISNKQALSLEELSTLVDLKEIVLVFDTNLVVDYRDFFLSAQKFKENKKDVYQTLRYLVEQTYRYNIETNVILGIDESTRRLSDFSRIEDKFHQTSQAVLGMLNSSIDDIDDFLKLNGEIIPIVDNSKKKLSKVKALSQDFIGSQLLTIGYVSSLKIVQLKFLQEQEVISRQEAFEQFLHFTTKEIDVATAAIINYAYHLFGGFDSLRGILFKTGIKSSKKEDVIHQIFNGSIDLIYPTLVNVIHPICYPELDELIPVFATRDKRLAELHSLSNTKLFIDNKDSEFDFELIEGAFTLKQNLSWSNSQINEFRKILKADALSRWQRSNTKSGQSAEHLIPTVMQLEKSVISLI